MNIICLLLGHEWEMTRYRAEYNVETKVTHNYPIEKHCGRCEYVWKLEPSTTNQ